MIELIVFLGNPGPEYRLTRHNAGWMVLDALTSGTAPAWQEKFKRGASSGMWCTRMFDRRRVHLLKPLTYMNLSGDCVLAACSFFRIDPQGILVVHDEIELPFGTVSFRRGGGLGGHNGLRSVAEKIGSRDFLRLRIGVGRPERGGVASFVLSRFSPDEETLLPGVTAEAARIIEEIASGRELDGETRYRRLEFASPPKRA